MLPVALGFGEGGRILQPLGIAVVGGLSFSMLTTLFLVPALQVSYLEYRDRRRGRVAFSLPNQKWTEPQKQHQTNSSESVNREAEL